MVSRLVIKRETERIDLLPKELQAYLYIMYTLLIVVRWTQEYTKVFFYISKLVSNTTSYKKQF